MKFKIFSRRTLVIAILFFTLLIGNSLVFASEAVQESQTAVIDTGALNIRQGPGVTYQVVTIAYQGNVVTLIGRNSSGSWAKVRLSSGTEGWLNLYYVTSSATISNLPVIESPAEPNPAVPVAPNALLSLRSGPSLSDSVVGSVFQGQQVQAIGRNADSTWVKLKVLETGLEGWISIAFIQLSTPIENLPVMDGGSTATPVPTATSVPTATPTPGTTPTPTPATGETAVIATGALNMRSGPGTAYGILTIVYHGHTVTLLGRNSDSSWAMVRKSTGTEGWVSTAFITSSVPLSSLPVLSTVTQTAVGTINTGAANVRSGPGLEYGETAVVYQYASVGLIGRNSNSSWIKVRLANDHIGWINVGLIDTIATISNLPVE